MNTKVSLHHIDNNRQQRSKERMLELATLILAKKPNSSITEIAEAIGVGRATLFRYFKSRKQLLHELVIESDRRLELAIQPIIEKNLNAIDTLEHFIKVLVPLGASFHFLNSDHIYAETTGIEELYRNQLSRMKNLAGRLKKEGVVAPEVPLAWVAAVLDNLIYTAWVTVSEGDIAPNDAPGLVLKSFLYGLASNNVASSRSREFS